MAQEKFGFEEALKRRRLGTEIEYCYPAGYPKEWTTFKGDKFSEGELLVWFKCEFRVKPESRIDVFVRRHPEEGKKEIAVRAVKAFVRDLREHYHSTSISHDPDLGWLDQMEADFCR